MSLNITHINPGLTALIAGHQNKGRIADKLSPIVPTEVRADTFRVAVRRDRAAMFGSEVGPSGEAQVVSGGYTTDSYAAKMYALKDFITLEDLSSNNGPVLDDMRAAKAEFVFDALTLERERRIATYFTTNTNYASANRITGSAWSGAGDPVANIRNAIMALPGGGPRAKKVFWCSITVWGYLMTNSALLSLLNVTDGLITPAMLAGWFGFDEVVVGDADVDTANAGQSASFSRLWGSSTAGVVLVPDGLTMATAQAAGTAAFHVTFRVTGNPVVRSYADSNKAGGAEAVEALIYDAEKPILNDAASIITGIS